MTHFSPNHGFNADEYFRDDLHPSADDDCDRETLKLAARLLAWGMSQEFSSVDWASVQNAINSAPWNNLRQDIIIHAPDGVEAMEASFDDFIHSFIWDYEDSGELTFQAWNIFSDAYIPALNLGAA